MSRMNDIEAQEQAAVDWLLRIRQLRTQGLTIEQAVAQAETEGCV